jgi:hypothetical protein
MNKMIPEKMLEVLKNEGVISIVTQGAEGPHVVNSWNSYIAITEDKSMLVPVGGMNKTESNINKNNNVLVTMGSREVDGFHSKGTGFLITGSATFMYESSKFDETKQRFPWVRAVLEITPNSITQTL